MAELLRYAAEQTLEPPSRAERFAVREAGPAAVMEWTGAAEPPAMRDRETRSVRTDRSEARRGDEGPPPGAAEGIVIPDLVLKWARDFARQRGMSLGQFAREAIEEKIARMRPKPRFGIFASGLTDTAERSTAGTFEPPPWRS
jgi:hypothetical protein